MIQFGAWPTPTTVHCLVEQRYKKQQQYKTCFRIRISICDIISHQSLIGWEKKFGFEGTYNVHVGIMRNKWFFDLSVYVDFRRNFLVYLDTFCAGNTEWRLFSNIMLRILVFTFVMSKWYLQCQSIKHCFLYIHGEVNGDEWAIMN